jgi:hypothetical protein
MALRDPEAGASPLALFGAELRHYRTAAGLSQEQLGERIGYSAALVGAVETARRMPTEDFTARCDVVEELATGGCAAAVAGAPTGSAAPAGLAAVVPGVAKHRARGPVAPLVGAPSGSRTAADGGIRPGTAPRCPVGCY